MKDYCMICLEKIIESLTWSQLILEGQSRICSQCQVELEKVSADHCQICSRPTEERKCYDCIRWQAYFNGQDILKRNLSLFTYNDFMKDIMYRWKYRGDYAIVYAFEKDWQRLYKQFVNQLDQDVILVPIPLSDRRLKERHFNQASQLAKILPGKTCHLLERTESEKQAKKGRKQRMEMTNPFKVKQKYEGHILLIDDLYTTGRTLRHAAQACKDKGAKSVSSLTLVRS